VETIYQIGSINITNSIHLMSNVIGVEIKPDICTPRLVGVCMGRVNNVNFFVFIVIVNVVRHPNFTSACGLYRITVNNIGIYYQKDNQKQLPNPFPNITKFDII